MTNPKQQMVDVNQSVVEDFRANKGAVDLAMGGFFAGKPVLLLHTTGAKTAKPRLNPLVYARHNGAYLVAASNGGAPDHPGWFFNVLAQPDVTVEVGTEKFPAKATIVEERQHRDALYAGLVAIMNQFAEYETMTDRLIPVVMLERND